MIWKYLQALEFSDPYWFILLLIIPIMIVYHYFTFRKQFSQLQISSLEWLQKSKSKSLREKLTFLPFLFRILTVFFLIIVLARPQSNFSRKETSIEGIDIVIAMDISSSMDAMDFKPSRMEAAKKVAKEFISGRPNDRIGLVAFSGEAFTQCPLTTDHKVLSDLFKPLKSGMIEDGTAIGDGLLTAVNRIKDSEAISKVIILLTDGVDNMSTVDPISAAEVAQLYGVRIYTIGVGQDGTAPMAVQTPFGKQIVDVPVNIDEALLKKVSANTDGQYFRARSINKLRAIYSEIDKMEKSKIDVSVFKNKYEEFYPFAYLALICFLIEIMLRLFVFNIKP